MRASRLLSAALLVALAAGCGQLTGPAVPAAEAPGTAVMVQGKKRTLDYDWERYKKVYQPKVKRRAPRQAMLPPQADLRAVCPPVYDQGMLGSCTAFAVGKGLRETIARQRKEREVPLSALFLYYETRQAMMDGKLGKLVGKLTDSGGTITDAASVLKDKGVCPDADWSYADGKIKFRLKPPAAAYASAKEFRVKAASQLTTLDEVRESLAKGQPVAFGFAVPNSVMAIGKSGVMPMPKADEQYVGGHAVLAVGYDDKKRMLTVRNSWGTTWGDKGYFYMPYDFVKNPNLADDFWVVP